MPNLFANANDWLTAQVQAAAGATVTYARGATSLTVTAVVGRTVFSSNADGGPRVEFGDRDYLVAVADLAALVAPRIGDRITDAAGLVFEVQEPNTGEPAWRYSDPDRTEFRVHCKRVS